MIPSMRLRAISGKLNKSVRLSRKKTIALSTMEAVEIAAALRELADMRDRLEFCKAETELYEVVE